MRLYRGRIERRRLVRHTSFLIKSDISVVLVVEAVVVVPAGMVVVCDVTVTFVMSMLRFCANVGAETIADTTT